MVYSLPLCVCVWMCVLVCVGWCVCVCVCVSVYYVSVCAYIHRSNWNANSGFVVFVDKYTLTELGTETNSFSHGQGTALRPFISA